MKRVSTSSLGVSSQAEDGPRWSSSVDAATGPTSALSSSTSLSSATVPLPQPSRRRLLYPALALILLILVTIFGSGTYYLVNSISQLSNARSLISQASTESAQKKPTAALQHLSQAQNALLSIHGPFLVGDQATQYNSLQRSLGTAFQKAIVLYNQQQSITALPCAITHSTSIIDSSMDVQPRSLGTLLDGNGTLHSYVLANNRNLYPLDSQQHLLNPQQFANNASPLDLAGSGQHLFALTSGVSGNTRVYSLDMLSLSQQLPALQEDSVAVDGHLISQGWIPTFLTAYGTDVYLILIAPRMSHQAMLVYYDANNWHSMPQAIPLSVSPDIVSVVAFPNRQLFLLTSDGHVKTFQYNANKPVPNDISLQKPVSPPLANEGTTFTANKPIAPPIPASYQVTASATPGSTVLVAGMVNSNPHLYVVDTPNHRIMDLEFLPGQSVNVPQTTSTSATTPDTSPTPSAGAGAVSQPALKLIQQFASTTILSAVKSATVSSDGHQLYLLTQNGGTLTTISPIDRVPSC